MISFHAESRGTCCCGVAAASSDSPAPLRQRNASLSHRAIELAGWLIPGTLLAFFPKCPLCVAGYVALATGLGMSLTAATYLCWALLAACLASLALMASRVFARRLRTPAAPDSAGG
ncbi:hypothetical protein [Lacipirellula limnantheis]|uniref:Uncharacterized protein n=1 Tax=Lacipirellula limnantheis TaxID=2528024 RepID=A0A517TU46_9BACT|nr:hypothetical protein [Lacipirellula limnantheis]QDT71888.1 hypothetical protein I41_10490 [Lacipirellula limnantheis]